MLFAINGIGKSLFPARPAARQRNHYYQWLLAAITPAEFGIPPATFNPAWPDHCLTGRQAVFMNVETQSSQFIMPDVGPATAPGGHDSDLGLASSTTIAARQARIERLLVALMVVIGLVLGWTGWDFFRTWQTYSDTVHIAILGLQGLCLSAVGVAGGAMLHSRLMLAESRRMEATNLRLAQERDLLRTIIDALPDFIYAKDREGRFVLNNPAHARDLGAASPTEMSGKSDFDFFPPDLAQQFFDDEQKIIATGEPVINQEQCKARPGSGSDEKIWSLSSKVLWRDRGGAILGTAGITRNIHEFKLIQEALRQSEEKLRCSAAQLELSNRELQDFAYVASHDLQEPLRKIVVFGERLKEKCGETLPAEPRDFIERMQKAAARMQTLINDLLAFSRVSTRVHPFTPVNLAEIAGEVREDLEARIEQVGGQVQIADLPVIEADSLQMRQLLQNLIGNALKFRRPDEPPVVTVATRLFRNEAGLAMCELTVADNGIGFEEKYLDRIFNVFQRLHSRNEYEGTGMGLAIVRKIALHHGGSVTARSRPGQGSTFIVTLPAVHRENPKPQST
jgi:PAS domain S-box-containing protein